MPRFPSVLVPAALALALLACPPPRPTTPPPVPPGTPGTPNTAALPPPGVVDGDTAHALVARGAKVVDVRTAAEFAGGHVPGAMNIPYDALPGRAGEIGGPAMPVVVYCGTGRRSAIAAETLRRLGYARVYDLRTYAAWTRAEPAGQAPRAADQ